MPKLNRYVVQVKHITNTGHLKHPQFIQWGTICTPDEVPCYFGSVEDAKAFIKRYYSMRYLDVGIRVRIAV
jgi:hypothetical protein